MELLQTIANYCPIRYGQAVYSARVLIQTQYGYENIYWNDEDLCVAGVDYRRNKPNLLASNKLDFTNFVIYPNPASTELNFKVGSLLHAFKKAKVQISIFDVLGQKVMDKEYAEFVANGKLDISILANGAYVLKYFCGSSEIYNASFIINK